VATLLDSFGTDTIGTNWAVYEGTAPTVDTGAGVLVPGDLNEFRMVNNAWAPEEDQFVVMLYKLSTTVSMTNRIACKGRIINGGATAGGTEQYLMAYSVSSATAASNALYLQVRRPTGTTEDLASYVGADLTPTASQWHALGVKADGDDVYAYWWHVGDDTAKSTFDPSVATPGKTLGPITLTGANKKLFGYKVRGKVVARPNADSSSHRWDDIRNVHTSGYTPNPVTFTSAPPWGATAWPDETWRPNEGDQWFGQAAARSADVLPDSDQIVARLMSMGVSGETFLETRVGTADSEDDWDIPLYWATGSDPQYALQSDNRFGTWPFNGTVIRMPAAAKQAAYMTTDRDRHLSVVQPDGVVWNVYDVDSITSGSPGEISMGWGGYCPHIDGGVKAYDAPNESRQGGSVAASINAHTGQIRAIELQEGEIRHPLLMVIPCSGGEIEPSPNTGQLCSVGSPGDGIGTPPKMGQWFRLNLTDAQIDGMDAPAWRKVIWKAMANYGIFVTDTKANNPGTIIRAESGQMYTSFGHDDPWDDYLDPIYGEEGIRIGSDGAWYLDFDTGMDWNNLQALYPEGEPEPPGAVGQHVPTGYGRWEFILTDRVGGHLGEFTNIYDRQVNLPLSRTPSASFRVRWDEPLADEIMHGHETLLKVYDPDKNLRFHGRPVSLEAVGEAGGQSLACTYAGATWNWQYRLMSEAAKAVVATTADRAQIARTLIQAANNAGETGIFPISFTCGSVLSGFSYGPLDPLSELITRLADALDGFDWVEQPVEWSSGVLANWNGAAVWGGTQENAVFEYAGGASNVVNFSWNKDWSTLGNHLYHVADDGLDQPGSPLLQIANTNSITEHGLMQAVVDGDGIVDTNLRNALLADHLAIRAHPREVYTFTPEYDDPERPGRVPVFGRDYDVGDSVRLRCGHENGTVFDGYVRVYSVQLAINSEGRATITPTCVPES
jgi:hypothetical protein